MDILSNILIGFLSGISAGAALGVYICNFLQSKNVPVKKPLRLNSPRMTADNSALVEKKENVVMLANKLKQIDQNKINLRIMELGQHVKGLNDLLHKTGIKSISDLDY